MSYATLMRITLKTLFTRFIFVWIKVNASAAVGGHHGLQHMASRNVLMSTSCSRITHIYYSCNVEVRVANFSSEIQHLVENMKTIYLVTAALPCESYQDIVLHWFSTYRKWHCDMFRSSIAINMSDKCLLQWC
jgi:hypothetical protein